MVNWGREKKKEAYDEIIVAYRENEKRRERMRCEESDIEYAD